MRLKGFLFIPLLLLNLQGFSQSDSTAYQKFFNDFLNDYKELTQPPIFNYYDILSNTGKLTFTLSNPLFKKAISEVAEQSKVDEMAAIDLLFNKTFTDLKNNFVWVSMMDIYREWDSVFDIYNNFLCSCLTSKVLDTDRITKMVTASQDCIVGLLRDSTFLNALKTKMPGKNLVELSKVQKYFVAYHYQNCERARHQWNTTILNTILEQYYSDISNLKRKEAERAIIYFKDKKFDSLSLIFPKYKKFIVEFKKITANLKGKDVTFNSNFTRNEVSNKSNVVTTFFKNSIATGESIITNSSNSTDSKIIAITFKRIAPPDKSQKVIEAKIGNNDVLPPPEVKQ